MSISTLTYASSDLEIARVVKSYRDYQDRLVNPIDLSFSIPKVSCFGLQGCTKKIDGFLPLEGRNRVFMCDNMLCARFAMILSHRLNRHLFPFNPQIKINGFNNQVWYCSLKTRMVVLGSWYHHDLIPLDVFIKKNPEYLFIGAHLSYEDLKDLPGDNIIV